MSMKRESLFALRYRILAPTCLLALAAFVAPIPLPQPVPQERHIQMQTRMFAFDPATLRVNRGDTVVLTLQSTDVVHGFYLDGYDIRTEIEPGRSTEMRFVVDQPGKFKFRCAVPCGGLHPFMIGELVVEPNLPFWRAVAASLIASAGAAIFFLRPQVPDGPSQTG